MVSRHRSRHRLDAVDHSVYVAVVVIVVVVVFSVVVVVVLSVVVVVVVSGVVIPTWCRNNFRVTFIL